MAGQSMEFVPCERATATHLAWGVKPTFLRYIAGVGGTITCADGAVALPEGFAFPVVDRESDGTVRASGTVQISAHSGLLAVVIRNPELRPSPGGEVLVGRSPDDRSDRILGVASAPLNPGGDSSTLTLHAEAVALFGDTYGPGTELDPVRFLSRKDSTLAP